MSMSSRLKSMAGGDTLGFTVAAATATTMPDSSNVIYLTGTATITSLNASNSTRNRICWFYQSDAGTTTFTNTNNTTTAGQMDLGGTNIAVGPTDVLVMLLRTDGSWVRLYNSDN